MTDFSHFIITRFNLNMWANASLDSAWYTHRFELFEQFCLPSILAQTQKNFTWLLLFDSTTPPQYHPRIETYKQYPMIQTLFIKGFDLPTILNTIRSQLHNHNSHLITTTLDNDDALANTFVERLQMQFNEQSFELINFTNGLRYNLPHEKLYECELFSNPFISLIERIEPNSQFRSIAGCLPHSTIPNRFPSIKNIETTPLWLQVIHERNMEMTKTWGRKRTQLSSLEQHFNLAYNIPPQRVNPITICLQHSRATLERGLINSLNPGTKERIRNWFRKGNY